jgi:hypothetical protein
MLKFCVDDFVGMVDVHCALAQVAGILFCSNGSPFRVRAS